MKGMQNDDLSDYLRFARAYASLGGPHILGLVDELATFNASAEGLNPALVERIKERLGGFSSELDEAIALWEDEHLEA